MPDKIDYEHEMSNGWNKYQMLVLTELKRLADGYDAVMALTANQTLEIALLKASDARAEVTHHELLKAIRDLSDRTRTIEDQHTNESAEDRGSQKTHDRWRTFALLAGSQIITWGIYLLTGFHPHHLF